MGRVPLTFAIGVILFCLGIAYAVSAWVNGWVGLLLYSTLPTMIGALIILAEVVIGRRRGR